MISHLSDSPIGRFGDALVWENPNNYVVNNDYNNAYSVPVLTANKGFILGYTDDTEDIYPASSDDPVIIFDDFTTEVKWVDFPFKVKSGAMKFFKSSDPSRFSLRFMYYALEAHPFTASTHQRHQAKFFALKTPLPSLEVQQQIVDILDAHNELQQLQAERVKLLKLEKDVLVEKIFDPQGGFKFSIGGKSFDTSKWSERAISEFITTESARPYIVEHDQAEYNDSWSIPVLTANKSFLLGYTNITENVVEASEDNPVIIVDDYTTASQWVDFVFKPKSRVIVLVRSNGKGDLRFIHNCIKMSGYVASTYQGHTKRLFAKVARFPIIEDQQIISGYFKEIDARIKLEEERLQLLKTQSAVVLESIFSEAA